MKKTLFRALVTLLALVMVVGMAAPALAAATVTCWVGPAWKGYDDPSAPGAQFGDFHRRVAEEYMKLHPDVTVNVEVIDSATREEKISIAIQSGTLPEIIFDAPFLLYDYAHAGLLEPLNDIIDEANYNDFPKSVWDDITTNGDIYMYPFNAETGHLAVNLDIFEAAGALDALPEGDMIVWTPEQFRTALEKVAAAKLEGVYPFAVYCNGTAGDTWNNILIRMYGASFFNDNATEIKLNSEEGVKGLQYLLDLNSDGLLAPGPESIGIQDSLNMFMNGKLAVSVFNNINYGALKGSWNDGSLEKFNLKWAYFPNEFGPTCFFYQKGSAIFKNGKAENIAAAKDFVRFYSTAPYTEASIGLSPLRTSVAEGMEDKEMAMIVDSLKYGVSFNAQAPGYLELRTLFFPQLQAAFTGQKTAKQALDDFAMAADRALAKNASRSVLLNK